LNIKETNGISIMFSFHAINASRAVTCSCNVHARYKSSCWLNNKKDFLEKTPQPTHTIGVSYFLALRPEPEDL
jgi:hypothetical protein